MDYKSSAVTRTSGSDSDQPYVKETERRASVQDVLAAIPDPDAHLSEEEKKKIVCQDYYSFNAVN